MSKKILTCTRYLYEERLSPEFKYHQFILDGPNLIGCIEGFEVQLFHPRETILDFFIFFVNIVLTELPFKK